MKPAPVTVLVEQLAADAGLGYPQAAYVLERPRPVSFAFGLLAACFWLSVGIGGLVFVGPTLLQEFLNSHARGSDPGQPLYILIACVALCCSLLGLYLLAGAPRAFHTAEWYVCPAGFILVRNGKGEAVRWDQVEDFEWDTRPNNEMPGWKYRFRRSDGEVFPIFWGGSRTAYESMGWEFELAIAQARR